MLDCKLCNYYHAVSGRDFNGLNLGICDFTDLLFIEDAENMTAAEYPCREMSYNDYLRKKSTNSIDPAAAAELADPEMFRELKQCGVSMIKFPEGIISKCFQKQLDTENSGALYETHADLVKAGKR
ncbi:hypothetical protein ACRQV7_10650 [Caproiciproducens sp. R2]|uniref:hypothetical protein n=1 Tax=Caproiciproducens sp. R2 TaxID=3435187 RepID=UPI0040333F99